MEEFLEYKSLQFKQAPVAAATSDAGVAGGKAPY
jgi:hypothetical protein